jgi:hypothetical protein
MQLFEVLVEVLSGDSRERERGYSGEVSTRKTMYREGEVREEVGNRIPGLRRVTVLNAQALKPEAVAASSWHEPELTE